MTGDEPKETGADRISPSAFAFPAASIPRTHQGHQYSLRSRVLIVSRIVPGGMKEW